MRRFNLKEINLYIPVFFIIFSLVTLIYILSNHVAKEYYSKHLVEEKEELYLKEKDIVLHRVTDIVKSFQLVQNLYPLDLNKQREFAENFIRKNYLMDSEHYIFVFDKVDLDNTGHIAHHLINYHKEYEGKMISIEDKDANNHFHIKELVKQLKENDTAFVEYTFNNNSLKTSYFYYYRPFNWIIASGFHMESKDYILKNDIDILGQTIAKIEFILGFFLVLFMVISYFVIKWIRDKMHFKQSILEILLEIEEYALDTKCFNKKVNYMFSKSVSLLDLNQISIVKNYKQNDELLFSKIYYQEENEKLKMHHEKIKDLKYKDFPIDFFNKLSDNRCVLTNDNDICINDYKSMLHYQTKSFLVCPIVIENTLWGYLCFEDYKKNRMWSYDERVVIRNLIEIFASSLLTQRQKIKMTEEIQNKSEQILEKEMLLLHNSKLATMGQMLSTIAHQWRQPLNHIASIVMSTELKVDFKDLSNNELKENLHEITSVLNNMSSTIDDFRHFFKPIKDKEEFYFKEAYDQSIKLLEYDIKINNIEVNLSDSNMQLYGYKNEFAQVVLALLTNSIDAFKSNSSINTQKYIHINCYNQDKYNYIVIEDNAGGISKDIIEKIWEPYFTTKSQLQGTGIGLYMIKMIIENHMDGSVWVESVNKKTKFKIKINEYEIQE